MPQNWQDMSLGAILAAAALKSAEWLWGWLSSRGQERREDRKLSITESAHLTEQIQLLWQRVNELETRNADLGKEIEAWRERYYATAAEFAALRSQHADLTRHYEALEREVAELRVLTGPSRT